MDFGSAFDVLADDGFWTDAAMVFAGFLAPNLVANIVEGRLGSDLPNELYGIGTAAAAEIVGGRSYRMVTVGGGVYTADALAQRFDLKQTVTTLGA
jgi:hypothetical protein